MFLILHVPSLSHCVVLFLNCARCVVCARCCALNARNTSASSRRVQSRSCVWRAFARSGRLACAACSGEVPLRHTVRGVVVQHARSLWFDWPSSCRCLGFATWLPSQSLCL